MPLILTDEQAMLRDSARDFMAEQSPLSQLRALRDQRSGDGFSRPLWQQFAQMGFTGVLVPEAHGGLGLGHVEAGVVMEQVGRQLAASPLLSSGIAAVAALLAAGSDAQQALWLPQLASASAIATLAVDEGLKHRPAHTAMKANVSDDGFVLEGTKVFVADGALADLLVVAARSAGVPGDTHGITLFLVPASTAGVQIERTVMVDAHSAARVQFSGVHAGADALLGPLHGGWPALCAALDAARCGAAAELLGLADEAFARTVQYLKERRQFGKVIGEFQGLQHRAAHLYSELEITRAAVLHAQQRLDADAVGTSAADAVAVAKARAGRTATLAVQEFVQMHGGMGMTDEFDAGFYMKRARVLQELYGDANFHLDQLALRRGY